MPSLSNSCYYCGYSYGESTYRELNYHGGLGRWICAFCFFKSQRVDRDLSDLKHQEDQANA